MPRLNEYDDLPPAMVVYLASRLTKVSKHARGHAGEKYRARARRRGTWGGICRRRTLARQRLALTNRTNEVCCQRVDAYLDDATTWPNGGWS
jgi:hypothetical protein